MSIGPDASVENVYIMATNLVHNLKRRLNDINSTWKLYHHQGLVPETDVFERLAHDMGQHMKSLKIQRQFLSRRVADLTSQSQSTLTPGSKGYAQQRMMELDFLGEVKLKIYDDIREFSEALTYITQHLNSRAGTLAASEATHGSNLTMHRFSGVQAIYDAAETLMGDYFRREGTEDKKAEYHGLVVFGYNYQAAAWKGGLTTFPLFAEHIEHFPWLVTLAHEAAHILQGRDSSLRDFRKTFEKRLVWIRDHELEGKSFVRLLGPVSVGIHTRFHPDESAHRRFAGEAVSDIFATLMAGAAYPRMLAKFILPLFADSIVASKGYEGPESGNLSMMFYSSSFKLRICIYTAELMGYMEEEEVEYLLRYINTIEETMHGIVEDILGQVPANPALQAALLSSIGSTDPNDLRDLKTLLADLRQNAAEFAKLLIRGVPNAGADEAKIDIRQLFDNYNKVSRYALFDTAENRLDEDGLRELFTGEVSFKAILQLWDQNPDWHPRHLISLLIPRFDRNPESNVNKNAVLVAMAHHPLIVDRYRTIKPKKAKAKIDASNTEQRI